MGGHTECFHNSLNSPTSACCCCGLWSRPSFTICLGVTELAGGLGVALGVLTQLAAIGLILIMLGAIHKKIFVWHTGFWGEKASGWHYDLMLVLMNLVIACTDGGKYVLWK